MTMTFKTTGRIRRAAVISRALGAGASTLAAQQDQQVQAPPPLPAASSMPSDPVKSKVILYESALRQAIDSAGQKLAKRAELVAPQVILQPDRLPEVRGIHLEGLYYFDVLIPNINPVAMRVFNTIRQNSPAQPPTLGQQVAITSAPEGKVAASGSGPAKIVDPDPMNPPLTLATFNPDVEYSAFSRAAIMDALIDLSGMLPIADGDKITISASGFPMNMGNPLYADSNRKLVVTIHGADLIEFRQGKISRDEAKARIKESRY
jgi:hypothetical protein